MNVRILSGYLPQDAALCYAPATREHGPLPRLVFEVMVEDSAGVEFAEKCLVDAEPLIARWRPLLTAGRAIFLQGEVTARRYVDRHGVAGNWIREIRAGHIEFPARGGARREEPAPAPSEAIPADSPV